MASDLQDLRSLRVLHVGMNQLTTLSHLSSLRLLEARDRMIRSQMTTLVCHNGALLLSRKLPLPFLPMWLYCVPHADGLPVLPSCPFCCMQVLDCHSNRLEGVEGLQGLQQLRVANLAGNRYRVNSWAFTHSIHARTQNHSLYTVASLSQTQMTVLPLRF